jgi:ABC-type transport system substrate-binding protein/DNA-binding beta-propeller fold protein YncE
MATTPIHGAGSDVGPYRIESKLGQGGMGVVYLARDRRLDRPVALKLLSPELAGDARFRARFERESRLAASIDHAGIVPVYEAGDAGGVTYIAMRYVEGSDLAQLLRSEGPLDPARAVDLVGQLADALDAAHARGLVHRDVKPSNALVAREGHVYLADFGLTKTSGPDTATASGQVVGTVAYMAPEVIRGQEPTPASDLYALGCVLFECLTGEVPYPGPNAATVIYGHLELTPPNAPELPAFGGVLARALAKDPAKRFGSGAELIAAARAALGAKPRRRRRSRRRLLAAAATAAGAAVAAIVLWPEEDPGIAAIRTDAAALIDPGEPALRASVELDGPPSSIAVRPDAIWVAGDRDGTVSRIDPETHTIRQTVTVGHGPSELAADRGGVWAANPQAGTVSYISAATNAVTDTIGAGSPSDVCLLDGDLWIPGSAAGTILRIDPQTHRRRTISLGATSSSVACGDGEVWTVGDAGRLMGVSPATNSVLRSVDVGAGADAVAVGEGAVWVANPLNGTVTRVDRERGIVTATVPVGATDEPGALVTGGGAVWVANRRTQTLARIDPERAVVTKRLRLGNETRSLAMVGNRIWAAVGATGAGHRGGTLRIALNGGIDPLDSDPATSYNFDAWMFLGLVHDGLTAYRRTGGRAGTQVVPNLAQSLPAPSDGGRTYTFALRRGVRFSTGRPVQASDVKRGIERSLNAEPHAFGLLGAIRSVTADDPSRTLVIRLKRPDPDLLYRLALPFASAVPPDVGRPPSLVPAATGPYRIAALDGAHIRLERNPAFRVRAPLAKPDGYPDVIEGRFGLDADRAVQAVRSGRADFAPIEQFATPAMAALRRRDPGLVRDAVFLQSSWVFLNTRVPPFDRADARRAFALAIDRSDAVAAFGGPHAARATCSILPPTSAGYRPDCPTRDLPEARRLVRRSGTRGALVTLVSGDPGFTALNPVIEEALSAIGYRTRVRRVPMEDYFRLVAERRNRVQIGPTAWGADYPSDSSFLGASFSCAAWRAGALGGSNYSQYCDPRADALMRRAAEAQTSDPATADALWAQAQRRVLDAAAAVPLFHPITTNVVSRRVRNDQHHPQWGFLPDQAWVR